MTNRVSVEQLISMCKANVSVTFALAEDAYVAELLVPHFRKEQLSNVTAENVFKDLACSVITDLVTARLEDPTAGGPLVVDDDVQDLSAALSKIAPQLWPSLADDETLHALLASVAARFLSVFTNYCALIHESQRAAVTLLTVTTVTLAQSYRVSVEYFLHDATLRARILKRLASREAWLEKALHQPLRETEWREFNDSAKAGLRATFERRAWEIWE